MSFLKSKTSGSAGSVDSAGSSSPPDSSALARRPDTILEPPSDEMQAGFVQLQGGHLDPTQSEGQPKEQSTDAAGEQPPALPDQPAAEAWQEATFAMGCFWGAEAVMGRVEGVLATRVGYVDGCEAVQCAFDPEQTSLPALIRR